MSRFLLDTINKLESYVPGEQPRDKAYIKLNTNESPFEPSEKVVKAIDENEIRDLRLYCDPECKKLKSVMADLYNVKPQNIFLSNGSDDILNFSFMAYGHKGVCYADITYGFYEVFSSLYDLDTEIIPLKEDFTLDADDYLNKNKMIVIANPNAPTGMEISLESIEEILKTNKDNIVLIDEAYVDFGGTSALPLIDKYNNLIVCRTFSKSCSLAGARLGFCFANEEIIKDLEKIKYSTNPYNINRLTQIAGIACVEDDDYYRQNAKKIIENREYTETELKRLGFSVLPSKANFIFAKSDKISGEELYLSLKDKGVLVRHFNKEKIKEYNRITIGSREEMEIFILKVKEILGEKA